MFYTLFAVLLLVVVALKYLRPFGERCPQCQTRRADPEYPMCPDCGWIYEVPGEDDGGEDDYAEAAEAEAELSSSPEEEEDLKF